MSFFKTSRHSLTTKLTAMVFAVASATAASNCVTTCTTAMANARNSVLQAVAPTVAGACQWATSVGSDTYAACAQKITAEMNNTANVVANQAYETCNRSCRDS